MQSKIYSKDGYDFYHQIFLNRQDFISYLKSAKTSMTFLRSELASHIVSDRYTEWTKTKTFNEALNLFEYGWHEDFDSFLSLKKQIDKYFPYIAKKKMFHNYVCGSVPNIVNAINNLPLSMRKMYYVNNSQNIITIHYNCSYPWSTTKEQIFTNGLLTLSLIDFFDSLGYRVNLSFFEISKVGNEVIYADIMLKAAGEKINLQKFYFAFCNPSFLRRLIFRVVETTNGVSRHWTSGYGRCMYTDEIKELLGINDGEILINWPMEMGIKGENIEEDIESFLNTIVLDDYIKVNQEEFNIFDDKHVLKRKKSNV